MIKVIAFDASAVCVVTNGIILRTIPCPKASRSQWDLKKGDTRE